LRGPDRLRNVHDHLRHGGGTAVHGDDRGRADVAGPARRPRRAHGHVPSRHGNGTVSGPVSGAETAGGGERDAWIEAVRDLWPGARVEAAAPGESDGARRELAFLPDARRPRRLVPAGLARAAAAAPRRYSHDLGPPQRPSRGPTAAAGAAPGESDGARRELAFLPDARRPRLLVPAGLPRAAAAALRRYSHDLGPRQRLSRGLTAAAVRTGLPERALKDRVRITGGGESVEDH